MCLTRSVASVFTRVSVLSFRNGIIGSILAQTGMLFWVRFSMAFVLCESVGALGSSCLASLLLSVVMVKATTDGIFLRISESLATRSDFVMIWMRQLCFDRVCRHFRVRLRFFSMFG